MNIISYNVNGVRAAIRKGLLDWLQAAQPEVFCLQEIKCSRPDFPRERFEDMGYSCHLFPAEKKGYSGTAILTTATPHHVEEGCGEEIYDREGRVIRADYADYSVLCVYMPSGSSSEERQAFKMEWLDFFDDYIEQLSRKIPRLIICGDVNICHTPQDIHNPKANQKTSGFLPEERAWVSQFLEKGFVDAFRAFNPEPHNYTWWSYRARARPRNLGWRIDYHLVAEQLQGQMKRAAILSEAHHSDHAPILLEMAE